MKTYELENLVRECLNQTLNESRKRGIRSLVKECVKQVLLEELSDDDAPLYVEYVSQRAGENPFEIRGQKYEYVNAKYPNGKIDIGVYAFAGDVVYAYDAFRKMHNIQESSPVASSTAPKFTVHYAVLGLENIPNSVHNTKPEAMLAAGEFIRSYNGSKSKAAGEKVSRVENGFALRHAAGSTVAIATVRPYVHGDAALQEGFDPCSNAGPNPDATEGQSVDNPYEKWNSKMRQMETCDPAIPEYKAYNWSAPQDQTSKTSLPPSGEEKYSKQEPGGQMAAVNIDEDGKVCGTCNGSGEGRHEGSKCSSCHGSGEAGYKKKLTKHTDPDYDHDADREERKLGLDEGIDDEHRDMWISQISDTYKEIYGFRPRSDMSRYSVKQLEIMAGGLDKMLRQQMDQEKADDEQHQTATQQAMTPKQWNVGDITGLKEDETGMNRRDRRDLSKKLAAQDTSAADRDSKQAVMAHLSKTNPTAAYKHQAERERKNILRSLGLTEDTQIPELTPTGQKDDWSRPVYHDQNGNVYVDINLGKGNPSIHSVTPEGEPEIPLRNYTIATHDPKDTWQSAKRQPDPDMSHYMGDGDRT